MTQVQTTANPVIQTSHGQTRQLVDATVVKWHILAAVGWIGIGMLAGLIYSFVFLRMYPHEGVELLSPGRVRMLHTNGIAYGFLFNAFLAMLYWVVPRLTGEPVLNHLFAKVIFVVWNLIVAMTAVGILMGHAQGIEWGETPLVVDHLVVVGATLVAIQFCWSIIRAKEKALYVSLWYFSAAFIWTALTYIMGNYLPQYYTPGAGAGAILGLYIHDLVGLFVTPMGWGMMYFFVPVIMKKPIYSHAISLIGFWGLAFFYPLNGVHHFLWSSIPMFAQYGAVVSTIAVEIVVTTVVINFFLTMRGDWGKLRTHMAIRWFMIGAINYFITCFQCAFQTTLTMQKLIHFSDWVVGHAHLVMFGVFSFWIAGMVDHLWPKLTGREWYSEKLRSWHFWSWSLGLWLMFLDLTVAGLLQGFVWNGLQPWEESVRYSMPFWWVRTVSGFGILAGFVFWMTNIFLTAFSARTHLDQDYGSQLVDA